MLQPDVNAGGLAVGAVLGETYELVRLIGQGGMGAVWEASHLRLPGKRVAVKVLLATIASGSEAFSRFRREAEIASRLGHSNIVEVLDFNVLPSGTPYLVLELLQGESLAQRLRRGPLPPGEALAITRQIGAALAAAHRHGVVHRDLKPDNVYLCPPTEESATLPRVKVLDFGISKIAGSSTVQTQEARVMGTPQYMAPEQAKGQNSAVDARTDVFALGAIVYEMLSGVPAFTGDTLAEVVFKVVYEAPRPLAQLAPGAPAAVLAAIARAMEKDAAARFPDVPSFIEALTGKPLATIDRGPPLAPAPPPRTAKGSSEDAYASTVISKAQPAPAALSPTVPSGDVPIVPLLTPVTVPGKRAQDPQPTPPPAPAPPAPGRRSWKWVALGVVLAGGAIGAYAATHPREPAPVAAGAAGPDAAAAPVAVPGPVPAAAAAPDAAAVAVAAPDAAAVAVAAPDAAAAATTDPSPPPPPKTPKTPRPPPPPPPSAEAEPAEELGTARAFLDQAQGALDAGRVDDAIRLARRSFNEKRTVRGFSILARAYCRSGDLGNAKAQLSQLPPRERQRVVRVCRRLGVELE